MYGHQALAVSAMSSSRRYVVARRRDGLIKDRLGERDSRAAIRLGMAAARRRVPRWGNPFIEHRARCWTHGWNVQHTRRGPCTGCKLCAVGTPVPETLEDWITKERD